MPFPRFFRRPADFSRWLQRNHGTKAELWVGFHKKGSGKPTLTWPESVDEALCWGWIDGIRKSIDESSYMIRFTPRRPGSNWSDVNIRRAEALTAEGRMQAPGLRAFEQRRADRTGIYSFERQNDPELGAALEKRFRANRAAWTFFNSQPPGYRRVILWWVVSAKREETRLRRLDKLIAASAAGRRIA